MRTPTFLKALSLMGGMVLSITACGPRIDTEDAIAANSQVLDESAGPSATGGDSTAGSSRPDGFATPGADDVGTPVFVDEAGPTAAADGAGGAAPDGAGVTPSPGGNQEAPTTPGESGTIRIGSVGNYSGPAGPPQAPMAEAVNIWAQYVNSRGGLFGREVQLFVVDDKGDPAQHVAALRDLVENKGVVAFVENAAALTAASGVDYITSAGVPVIGTECALPFVSEHPLWFNQCPHVETQFFGSINQSAGLVETPKMAMFYCREASVCSNANRALREHAGPAGVEVVYEAQVSLVQPDFTSECRQAQQAGATLLWVVVDPTGVERAAQSCARQNYFPTFSQGSATVFHSTKDAPGFRRLSVEMPAFPFVGTHTSARREFQQVMAAFRDRPPGPAEAIGWAAAKIFEEAAVRAARAAGSITSKTLIDALRTIQDHDFDGLTVPLSYPKSGGTKAAECWYGLVAEDGEWTVLNDGKVLCKDGRGVGR